MEILNFFAQDAQGNIMPSAECYLYAPGTTNLVSGLVDINGMPISNPFQASSIGQVQFGAPNGVYDLRMKKGARDTTIKIQCADLLQALNETASFLGAKSSAPTTRNDGYALQIADRYFNTVDQLEYLYKSTGWVANNLDGQLLATSRGASLLGALMQDGSPGTIQEAIDEGDNSLRQDLSATTGAKEIGTENGKLDVVLDEMLFDTRGSRPSLTSVMGVDDRYLPIAKLVRATGDATYNALYGVKREIQSFAPDEVNRKYYSLHNNNDPVALKSIVTRYVMDSEGVAKAQDAVATPGNEFGHQGIAVENLPGNAVKIWCTDGLNPLGVIRFDFANGQPALNKEHYVLFSAADGFNAGISSFQGFSVDNQYVIGSAKVVGSNIIKCRLWLLSDLLDGGPGDYSASYKYEIDVSSLYDADHPIQGLACDNSSVYGVSGGNTLTAPARWMAKWDIATGALLETNHNVMIGSIEAALDGSGISYEPEGLNFVVAGGAPKLCVGIRSGSSLTPSVFRVHAINLKPVDRINARGSGKVLSIQRADEEIGSMEVNTSALMMMAAPGRQLRLGANGAYHIEIDTAGNLRSFLDGVPSVGTQARRFNQGWFNQIRFGTGLAIRFGTGSPEGVVSEGPATIYMDFGNGDLYCKKSGTGNTNWKLITMAG